MEPYRVPVTEGDRIRADAALSLSGLALGVPVAEMTRRERVRPRACRARWSAMYLAHVSFGWPLERVAHAFGLNRRRRAPPAAGPRTSATDPTTTP